MEKYGKRDVICLDCGHIGRPKKYYRGSLAIEIVLWLCFLVPGLVYTLWRDTSRYKGCRICKSTNIIPINSPNGKKYMQANKQDPGGIVLKEEGVEKLLRA